jgi:uncharacterized repeat protein (TIGR01451 family)
MKVLLLVFVSFAFRLAYGQVYNVGSPADTIPAYPQCSHQILFSVSVSSNPDLVTISMNWGDGTTTDSTFLGNPGNNSVLLSHSYAVPGIYNATYSVFSQLLNENFVEDIEVDFIALASNMCGYVYSQVAQSDFSYFYTDVPLDFTGADGVTTTVYPTEVEYYQQAYGGLDINNTPYSINVNEAWLDENQLVQVTGTLTISSFNTFGQAYNVSGFFVECNPGSSETDAFIQGVVWGFIAVLEYGGFYVYVGNNGCGDVMNAQISIEFPDDFVPIDNLNLPNFNFVDNTLSFTVVNLDEPEIFDIPFNFPGNTPLGTFVCFPATITVNDDLNLMNNVLDICGIVSNSYDPNDKQVNQPANINPDEQETFLYQIRFQNDGNYPALNVVVRDTISENLDLSTFRLLETSHPVAYQVNPSTREITFTFSAIWLESSEVDLEASQGYILYEIDEAAGLVEGDAIENTAHIFFDFNPAIVTNTTVNTNVYPVGVIENDKPQLSMYPNPASSSITFSGAAVQKVVIYDVLGQVVLTRNITNNTLSLSGLNNGVYFVEMHTEAGVQTQRLVLNK